MPFSSICENNFRGLVAVLGLFLQSMLQLGTVKSIAVYFSELQASLGTTRSDVGLILGLYTGFTYMPGFGGCILSVCYVITLEKESDKKFQLLYGVGKSGYSFGMVLVPFIAEYLMNTYGWRGSMMIIGAIAGNIVPLTTLADVKNNPRSKPDTANAESASLADDEEPEEPIGISECIVSHQLCVSAKADDINDSTSLENPTRGCEDEPQERLGSFANIFPSRSLSTSNDQDTPPPRKQTIRHSKALLSNIHQQAKDITSQVDPWIYVFIIACAFCGMVSGGWHAFLIPRTVSRGIPLSTAIYLLYPASVGCLFGRALSGLPKNKCLSTVDLYLLVNVFNVFALLLDIMVPIFTLKFATTFFSAFCIAETNILTVFLCKDRTSPSFFPVIFSSAMVFNGLGNLIGTYLTGLIADLTGNYNASFMLLVAFDAVIICLTIPTRYFPSKYRDVHELARG